MHLQTGHIFLYYAIATEFLTILSKVSRGSVEEKLQWVFGLYDLDGDGHHVSYKYCISVTCLGHRATLEAVKIKTIERNMYRQMMTMIAEYKYGNPTPESKFDPCGKISRILLVPQHFQLFLE
ncbi:hypothetical protein DBV15_09699 [Temnothorax longispinosus]|uniref:EF-hand domain-containing protein n=1 Tax=Temnothorax longispinosus TaxID=300112 RepID=A0A4S2L5V9_9HYME|nr:hypothetical protein DBV15_09699 [Temnothorax longispinosus]